MKNFIYLTIVLFLACKESHTPKPVVSFQKIDSEAFDSLQNDFHLVLNTENQLDSAKSPSIECVLNSEKNEKNKRKYTLIGMPKKISNNTIKINAYVLKEEFGGHSVGYEEIKKLKINNCIQCILYYKFYLFEERIESDSFYIPKDSFMKALHNKGAP